MTDQPTAPPPPDHQQPTSAPPQPGHRLKRGLTGTLRGFLIASGGLLVVAGLARVNEFNKFDTFRDDGGFSALADLSDAEDFSGAVLAFGFLAGVTVAVLMIIWLYQAYRAAAQRGGTNLSWSSGWAVGAWFIPVANLILPKLVFNETERLTSPDAGAPPVGDRWRPARLLGVGNVWWVLWVAGLVLWTVGFTLAEGQIDDEKLRTLLDFNADQYANGLSVGALGLIITGAAGFVGSSYIGRLGRRLHG